MGDSVNNLLPGTPVTLVKSLVPSGCRIISNPQFDVALSSLRDLISSTVINTCPPMRKGRIFPLSIHRYTVAKWTPSCLAACGTDRRSSVEIVTFVLCSARRISLHTWQHLSSPRGGDCGAILGQKGPPSC